MGAEAIVNVSVIIDNGNDTVYINNEGQQDLKVYISQNPADEAPENAKTVAAGQAVDFIAQDLGYADNARRLLLFNASKQAVNYKVEVV